MPNLHEITATPQPTPCRFEPDANLHGNGAAPQPTPCRFEPDANLHGNSATPQPSPCRFKADANLHGNSAAPQPSPCRFKADANLHGNGAAPQPSPCRFTPDANLHGNGATSQPSPCRFTPDASAAGVGWGGPAYRRAMTEPRPEPLRVATEPRTADWIDDAVRAGGAALAPVAEAAAVVWTAPDRPDELAALLDAHPNLAWVQLPWAGIEPYLDVIRAHPDRTWSCATGVYAEPVAEHALALLLAGFRHLATYARAETWTRDAGRNLHGARLALLGGGGITRAFLRMVGPFACDTTVVRRSPEAVPGATRTLPADRVDEALTDADAVVLALPLLDATRHVLDARRLALLAPGAWVVNVARGAHVDTEALVDALRSGHLGGAALDVTDPEPLPDGHPLWSMPNVLITPHTGNTKAMARPLLSGRITDNVRRRIADEPLLGLVDPDAGY